MEIYSIRLPKEDEISLYKKLFSSNMDWILVKNKDNDICMCFDGKIYKKISELNSYFISILLICETDTVTQPIIINNGVRLAFPEDNLMAIYEEGCYLQLLTDSIKNFNEDEICQYTIKKCIERLRQSNG